MGKRAKWASPKEIESRRRDGRCLRYGRSSCRIARYPLLLARNPNQNSQRRPARVNKAKVVEVVSVNELEESDKLKE